jgi:LysR family transcriptional activator of nhaA
MSWLNYHHLRYFRAVARAGGIVAAARELHVSAPSISTQLAGLEDQLGVPLFRRAGRARVLTEAGRVALDYAEQIFSLGDALVQTLREGEAARAQRFLVGIADAVPKLIAHEMLKPVFALPQELHVICREGKLEDLMAQLAAHRLDLLLSDEPASVLPGFRVHDRPFLDTDVTVCAAPALARRLRPGFPRALHGAPALLPADNTALRRAVDAWFRANRVQPRVAAEFEDLALMKVMAAEGRGFIVVPTLAVEEAVRRFGFVRVGRAARCRVRYHAIIADRHAPHPAVQAVLRDLPKRRVRPAG